MIDHRHHFDEQAAEWDNDPQKVERAKRTAQQIVDVLAPSGSEKTLEFGAGTGLVSQYLAPHVGQITLVDNSPGMRDILSQKIASGVLDNAKLSDFDLVAGNVPEEKYHLIIASLVLHHVADVPALLASFASILEPGGVACIIELDSTNGAFHAHLHDYDGHDGFDRESLRTTLKHAGFSEISFHDAGTIVRDDGEYSLFLAHAHK